MSDKRYCRRCDKATDHRCVRVNAFGDEDEGYVSRAFFGFLSAGMSEICSENVYECLDCGSRRS